MQALVLSYKHHTYRLHLHKDVTDTQWIINSGIYFRLYPPTTKKLDLVGREEVAVVIRPAYLEIVCDEQERVMLLLKYGDKLQFISEEYNDNSII